MINIVIKNEERDARPARTVTMEFRRHKSAGKEQIAWLVANDGTTLSDRFPVKMDGINHMVEIRKADFEALGFTVLIR